MDVTVATLTATASASAPVLQPWFADRTRRQPGRQEPQGGDEHRRGVQANLDPGGCEQWWRVLSWPSGAQTLHDSNNVGNQSIAYQGYPRTAVTVRFDCGRTGRSVARGARVPVRRRRQEVREHEPIAFDDDAGHSRDRAREHRSGSDAGVKLAAFTAWIGRGGRSARSDRVEGASGERTPAWTRGSTRSAAPRGRRRSSRAPAPAWDGPHSGKSGVRPLRRQALFAVAPDILEKEVAEGDVRESVGDRRAARRGSCAPRRPRSGTGDGIGT